MPAPPDGYINPEHPPAASCGLDGSRAYPEFRIVLMPGLEFDPTRKFRYGLHALLAAVILFISFIIIELRNCKGGPGIDLDTLQALQVILMLSALSLYLLSLFGIADFIFQYKVIFFGGLVMLAILVGLMVWTTYEAATNPCVPFKNIPISINIDKNVFSKNDSVGIIVFLLDIVGTFFFLSAAISFYKRY